MELILPRLRPYQIPVLTSAAVDDFTISAPQLGKTLTAALWLFTRAYLHGPDTRPWWWTAPTYGQLMHGYDMLEEFSRNSGLLAKATTSHPFPRIFLRDGERFEFRSWERAENMRGPTVLGGVSDEFGVGLTRKAYNAMSSRRTETLVQGLGRWKWIGNVGDIGGFAETLWRGAEAGSRNTACRRWTWRDRALAHECGCGNGVEIPTELGTGEQHADCCPRGMYVQRIEDEADVMSGPQFRREYDAEWADWSELPIYTFDRAIHVREVEHSNYLPLDLACDFNVDPMCWVIGQHKGEEAWVIDELVLEGGCTTQDACAEFIRRYPNQKTEVVVYGDASGKARSTKSKRSDYDIIAEILGRYYQRFRIEVPSANPPVAERINAYNARLRSATGSVRYYVHPACTWGADDLARTSYRPGTRDIDKGKDKRRSHWTDAEGYRMHALYPVTGHAEIRVVTHSTSYSDEMMGETF